MATKQSQADGITNFYLCLVAKLLTRGGGKTMCTGEENEKRESEFGKGAVKLDL